MTKLQWVNKLAATDVQNLVKSIDTVLFDVDGVLVRDKTVIPGSADAVAKLRKLGKQIGFVTNNSIYPLEIIKENLLPFGATVEEIMSPNTSLLAYLKKIGFKKDIYIVGSSLPKNLLKEAGYNIIEYKDIQPTELEEYIHALKQLSSKIREVCKNVGIVYLDLDFNLHYGAILVAKFILNQLDDVQLLSGMSDDRGPIDEKSYFIGPQFYVDAIEKWTNKNAIKMAKPGQTLGNIAASKFEISDSSRILMVGDNIMTDIAFGKSSGFKTCLVLSGLTKKEQVDEWNVSEELKPDYVASNLGEIYEKIKDL